MSGTCVVLRSVTLPSLREGSASQHRVGKELPPSAPEDLDAARKRGVTNKKVSNRRLKMELGYQFKYPTFRQGYTAEIVRLDRAGELH